LFATDQLLAKTQCSPDATMARQTGSRPFDSRLSIKDFFTMSIHPIVMFTGVVPCSSWTPLPELRAVTASPAAMA
jgi:hypothetical protein